FGGGGAGVYKSRITPHWFDSGSKFWYQNDLARGTREFILVDAASGKRERAFDHEKLAAALKEAGIAEARADRLPIEELEFKTAAHTVEFTASKKRWRCNLNSYAIAEVNSEKAASTAGGGASPQAGGATATTTQSRRSRGTGAETELTF